MVLIRRVFTHLPVESLFIGIQHYLSLFLYFLWVRHLFRGRIQLVKSCLCPFRFLFQFFDIILIMVVSEESGRLTFKYTLEGRSKVIRMQISKVIRIGTKITIILLFSFQSLLWIQSLSQVTPLHPLS